MKKGTLLSLCALAGLCWLAVFMGQMFAPGLLEQPLVVWPCLLGLTLCLVLALTLRPVDMGDRLRWGPMRLLVVMLALLPLTTWSIQGYLLRGADVAPEASAEREALMTAIVSKLYTDNPTAAQARALAGTYYEITGLALPVREGTAFRPYVPTAEAEAQWREAHLVDADAWLALDRFTRQEATANKLAARYSLLLLGALIVSLWIGLVAYVISALRRPKRSASMTLR